MISTPTTWIFRIASIWATGTISSGAWVIGSPMTWTTTRRPGFFAADPGPESVQRFCAGRNQAARKLVLHAGHQSSNIMITPALKWSPARGCNGMSRPNKWSGRRFRARCARPRALTRTCPNPRRAHASADSVTGSAGFRYSETVIAYELGYRAQLGPKVSDTSISTFYNDYDDVRSTGLSRTHTLVCLAVYFQNNLEGETYGFELSANYQVLDWWRLHGGYDLLKEDIHVKPGQLDLNDALNETADPEHQFPSFLHGFALRLGTGHGLALGGHVAQSIMAPTSETCRAISNWMRGWRGTPLKTSNFPWSDKICCMTSMPNMVFRDPPTGGNRAQCLLER